MRYIQLLKLPQQKLYIKNRKSWLYILMIIVSYLQGKALPYIIICYINTKLFQNSKFLQWVNFFSDAQHKITVIVFIYLFLYP